MNKSLIGISILLAGALCSSQAMAWASANRFGGSTAHVPGATEHTNAFGGSSEHAYGEGTEHTNAYGGSTAHAWGGGTEHTDAYGATAYRPPAYPGYRPPAYPAYPVYHPPVAVPAYSSGCYGCAAAAGAVVGVAAGAAVASANTAAATSNAYAAGVAAGAASAPVAYAMGVNYAALPSGASPANVGGATYYIVGNTWFKPMYGANGVYYRVVPTP
ncbi:hypothetical protein [Accumulibacter sp.]|uniref:RNA-binding protein n=1 Tax=Candidatus Accumulibacter proximus TaxID=2954385 RepID=A0A935Q010_9PROT|nr:hypothetical protein [Accumulibacter sp.]MBK7675478.1 hypothetical protein [Candidatus Accumulibacter proximus]MBL8374640.1 hypothetical protein [Accumulibacter sp.]